jgi:hypothetical protein
MEINKKNIEVIFKFSPASHFLVHENSRSLEHEWSLNPRIDRSEKGKDDDMGSAEIYLSDEDAEQCEKAGFSYIEINN